MSIHTFRFFALVWAVLLVVGCKKDENTNTTTVLEVKTFSNLYAPQTGGQGQPVGGAFTRFSFAQNAIVTNDSWDIAFRGTTILVNGGANIGITDEPTRTGQAALSIVSNTLEAVKAYPAASSFKQDGANTYALPIGSGNGWYAYDAQTNLINPIAGKVFVVKTHDGKYAKFEILSYYKDAPTAPTAQSETRYFTFRFAYQSNSSTTF